MLCSELWRKHARRRVRYCFQDGLREIECLTLALCTDCSHYSECPSLGYLQSCFFTCLQVSAQMPSPQRGFPCASPKHSLIPSLSGPSSCFIFLHNARPHLPCYFKISLSAEELILLNRGVEEDSCTESLGLQGDPTSQSWRKSVLNIHWKDLWWSWNSNTLVTWWEKLTHLKRPCCRERLKVGGEGDDRGWDGWLASLTWWTWVWVSSGC